MICNNILKIPQRMTEISDCEYINKMLDFYAVIMYDIFIVYISSGGII